MGQRECEAEAETIDAIEDNLESCRSKGFAFACCGRVLASCYGFYGEVFFLVWRGEHPRYSAVPTIYMYTHRSTAMHALTERPEQSQTWGRGKRTGFDSPFLEANLDVMRCDAMPCVFLFSATRARLPLFTISSARSRIANHPSFHPFRIYIHRYDGRSGKGKEGIHLAIRTRSGMNEVCRAGK